MKQNLYLGRFLRKTRAKRLMYSLTFWKENLQSSDGAMLVYVRFERNLNSANFYRIVEHAHSSETIVCVAKILYLEEHKKDPAIFFDKIEGRSLFI